MSANDPAALHEEVAFPIKIAQGVMRSLSPQCISDLEQRACGRIGEMPPALLDVSRKTWEHPEIAFQERDACRWLSELLADAGY